MKRRNLIAGLMMLSTLSILGCGGGSGSSGGSGGGGSTNTTPLTQAQAEVAFTDIANAMADAAGGALAVGPTNPLSQVRKEEVAGIQKAILNGVPMPASKNAISPAPEVLPDTTTILPTYTYNCPSGGTIVVTGSFTETSNSDSMTIVETPKSCKDSGVTFSGDPDIAISDTATDNGTTTTATLTITGGISVSSSSCSIDVAANVTESDSTGHGSETIEGTFCGQSLGSGNYTF